MTETAPDLYQTLEVDRDASTEEIEAAFRRLSEFLNPDSLALYSLLDSAENARLRAELVVAHRVLTDPETRRSYDRGDDPGLVDRALAAAPGSRPRDVNSVDSDIHRMYRMDSEDIEPEEMDDFDLRPVDVETRTSSPVGIVPSQPREAEHNLEETPPRILAPPPRSERPAEGPRLANEPPASTPSARFPLALKPERVPGPDAEYAGPTLRALRESTNASLDELAEITKISRRYLVAIETHDFSSLPAAVYVRGFVSEYARSLGLDPQVVANSYMAIYRRYHSRGR